MLEVVHKIAQKFTSIYQIFPKEEKEKADKLNWKREKILEESNTQDRVQVYQKICKSKLETITILETKTSAKENQTNLENKDEFDFRKTFF